MGLWMLVLAFGPWILGLSGGFYLGLRAVRAMERRSSARKELDALNERTLRLEESISEVNEKLGRLADSQEFTTRLLADKK